MLPKFGKILHTEDSAATTTNPPDSTIIAESDMTNELTPFEVALSLNVQCARLTG